MKKTKIKISESVLNEVENELAEKAKGIEIAPFPTRKIKKDPDVFEFGELVTFNEEGSTIVNGEAYLVVRRDDLEKKWTKADGIFHEVWEASVLISTIGDAGDPERTLILLLERNTWFDAKTEFSIVPNFTSDMVSQKTPSKKLPSVVKIKSMAIVSSSVNGHELKTALNLKHFKNPSIIKEEPKVIINTEKKVMPQNSAKAKKAMGIKDKRETPSTMLTAQPEKVKKVNKPVKDVEKSKKTAVQPKKVVPIPKGEKKIVSAKRENPVINFLTALIEEGKMTQKEICTRGKEIYPDLAPATISTLLSDSKNPKYNKFCNPVVIIDGKMTFVLVPQAPEK